MHYAAGPKSNNYPQYYAATGNLIHDIGTIDKQISEMKKKYLLYYKFLLIDFFRVNSIPVFCTHQQGR